MDGLESFGQLSLAAKEWKPSSAATKLTSDRLSSSASDLTSSYGSGSGSAVAGAAAAGASYGSAPLSPAVPQSPVTQMSPLRTGGLLPSPPGRTAWQQHQKHEQGGGHEGFLNAYAGAESWNASPVPSEQPPAWPDVSSNQPHEGYADIDVQQGWQQAGPISIPAGPPPPPAIRSLHALPDDLWRYYRDISFESQREMDISDPRYKAIPHAWGNAFPLDVPNGSKGNVRSSFGYPISTFKVVSREDGHLYCLRRVDSVRSVSHKIAQIVTDMWLTAVTMPSRIAVLDHPGLVRFYQCFVANRAVFFVHQYCPGARTLRERFLGDAVRAAPLSEPMIWSCVTQLVAAIRTVHGGNMACRTLQLNHILCHGEGRIRLRINCLAVVDALEFESRKQVGDLQTEDMRDLGRLILSLATGTEVTKNSDGNTIRRCDMHVAQNCSAELHMLILSLLQSSKPPSIFAISNNIAQHALDEVDLQQTTLDRTEAALSAEYDSGRALRLLLKMAFVNERPELGRNRRWIESGDCYVLKLFRDYAFHQADAAGNPVMDLGHAVTALNKLDACVEDEQIILASRDSKTLMVVTYADVAQALERAYGELCDAAVYPQTFHHQFE